ncbi:MAG: 2-oxoacid:ferredoxin oxidoreductase subunit gamma [bacterium]|nr:2-oxoacid:ferredoxin oxidoreductase subunit gamma [bacterium]
MRTEIKVAGFGGQGVVTLSMLFVTAINLYTNKAASQTDAYGPQARGGDCWAEVVIDDDDIDFPKTIAPDYSIFLSQVAFRSFANDAKDGGMIILDPSLVTVPEDFEKSVSILELPVQDIALDEFENSLVANIILFAAFVGTNDLIPLDAARLAVEKIVPPKALEENMKAFERGLELAETIKQAA